MPTAAILPAELLISISEARQDSHDFFMDSHGDRQQLTNFLVASQSDCFAPMKDGEVVYD